MEVIAETVELEPNGRRCIIGTLVDIHERKEASNALRRAREAAGTANREKSEFQALVSRELRAPLGALVGMSKLLCDAKLTPQEREVALALRLTQEGLLGVLNSLLDLSRLEAGLMKLAPEPVDIRLASEDVIETFASKADRRHLDLSLRYEPDVPKRVLTDQGRYRQLLSIFVDNALANTRRGHVIVAIGSQVISATEIQLEIEIQDTGSGLIPRDALAANHSPKRRGNKLEMGLALARQLVTFLNGSASIEAQPGAGSTVKMKLLCARDPQAWLPPVPPCAFLQATGSGSESLDTCRHPIDAARIECADCSGLRCTERA